MASVYGPRRVVEHVRGTDSFNFKQITVRRTWRSLRVPLGTVRRTRIQKLDEMANTFYLRSPSTRINLGTKYLLF